MDMDVWISFVILFYSIGVLEVNIILYEWVGIFWSIMCMW